MKKAKKIYIAPAAIASRFPVHSSVTFFLVLKLYGEGIPQWFIGILWFLFIMVWLLSLYNIWNQVGNTVNPLDTYNRDPHPMDAYKQDMGLTDAKTRLKKHFSKPENYSE